MIFKNKFSVAVIVLAAILLCSTIAVCAAGEELLSVQGSDLNDRYIVGETLDLRGVRLSVGGSDRECDKFLTYPSGVTARGETFPLDEAGEYCLKLQCEVGGRTHVVKRTFSAVEPYCRFETNASSATLTENGYRISLSNGDTVTFGKVLDVSRATSADSLLRLTVLPTVAGKADFTVLNITFTDVNDPDSTLRFRLRGYENGTYGLVGSTYQPLTGYEPEWDRLHKDNQWGAFTPTVNFFGLPGTSANVDIRLDVGTLQAYFTPGTVIADLNDPRQFANVWGGFTSGKVKVSVSADDYDGRLAVFEVTELGGERPQSEVALDEASPDIRLPEGDMPTAQVGKPYPLPVATATDTEDGEVPTAVAVFRNYDRMNRYHISVADNAFVPTGAGDYYVEYSARDKAGNTTRKVLKVHAVEELPALRITAGRVGDVTVGDTVEIPACSSVGGSGSIRVPVRVSVNGNEVEVIDGQFRVTAGGVYTIAYTATDYIGNRATTQTMFTPEVRERAVLNGRITLPRYMIVGKTYALPRAGVTDFSAGYAADGACDVYVLTANGERRLSDFSYTPADAGEVRFVYKYRSLLTKTFTVKCVDVGEQGSLDMAKYLFGYGGTVSAVGEGIEFVSTGSGNATVEFIRSLLCEDLLIRFSADPVRNRYDRIEVVLTDSEDETQQVRLGFAKNGKGVSVYLNGEYKSRLLGFGFGEDSATNTFSITFDGKTFVPYADVNIEVDRFDGGETFNGFGSGKVYVSFRMINSADARLLVENIGGQLLNDGGYDRVRPRIVIAGDYGGECRIGDLLQTAVAAAEDVLDPDLTFTMSVKGTDGYVTDVNGVLLKDVSPLVSYRFRAEAYGNYIVSYSAADTNNGKSTDRSYSVTCGDKTPPEITLTGGTPLSCKVGDIVSFPTYRVSGDVAETYVFITSPNGVTSVAAGKNDSFVADREGRWLIVIVAYGTNGNMAHLKVTVEVTKS